MDHAIRIFHLNHSVHSSVSEHQESTKSAKYYTKREKNKCILNSHWGKNKVVEARTKVWWNEQEKKCFFNMPFFRSKYSKFPLARFSSSLFAQHPVTIFNLEDAGMYGAISKAIFYEINPHNNLPINQDFVISEVMQNRHCSRHQTGYWLQTMWVGRIGTKQLE